MRNFPEQFEASVRRFPDRLAVSVRGEERVERFTYRQLAVMADRAACVFKARGVGRGDRCAILAENSARWCAAYLGILRLGAVAVPFDTSYTAAQVATLLSDCGATALLASRRFEAPAREAGASAACAIIALEEATHGDADRNPEPATWNPEPGTWNRLEPCPASSDDPAVILYTSGTTADPKGVVLTHGNLLAEKDAAFAVISVEEDDAVLGVLPLFHALALLANFLLPFSAGAHVVFLETLNTRELLRALDGEGISIFVCVPQFFYLIHQRVTSEVARRGALARAGFNAMRRANGALRRAGINAGRLLFRRVHRTLGRRVRLLVTGGSRFDEAVGRELYDLGFTILQAYGLTESSGAATVTRPGEPIHTVGTPLPGVQVRIAADGEILIRGPIVMQGYWGRHAATSGVLREGWLHTGDLGRLDDEGRLTITGRSKDVIVLGSGKNIYPEEVEEHYGRSPFVRELCVVGIAAAGEPSSERLHALVVPDADVLRERKIVNTRELIRFELEGLSVSLPSHKRVLGFDVTMDPLPRTTTGKLMRREILKRYRPEVPAVPAGPAAQPAADTLADAHLSRIVALVRDAVRGSADVRPDSNLELDLGLDSMQRVELLALLEQRFGMRVPGDAAQRMFLVRDMAEAFRGATEAPAATELAWDSLLELQEPGPELRVLLEPRFPTALLLFAALRAAVHLLARPRAAGLDHLPRRGPFIISPNHQSYLDPFVLLGVLPFEVFRQLFFVGAAEYFQNAVSARFARIMNVVPVDPDANLLPAMQAGAFGLKHGKVLVLFPEGERSIDGGVKTFRKGAAILSRHLEVPIVPVAINGVFEIWPRNRPLDWRRLMPWSGHRTSVRFGAPLHPPDSGATYEAHTAALRSAVEEMWLAARP